MTSKLVWSTSVGYPADFNYREYYRDIGPAMLPHVADRGLTLRRYPNGVDGKSFFEKRCPSHRPDWVGTFVGPGDRDGTIGYCALDSTAALAWAANLAALNLTHASSSRRIARVLLLAEPPSIAAGEVTDKGYVNQRAVLERRATLVERLYGGEPAPERIVLSPS